MPDLNRATEVTDEVRAEVVQQFTFAPWDVEKIKRGKLVVAACIELDLIIIANVPPGPDRSVAQRKLRELRMDCNSAIAHGGKY